MNSDTGLMVLASDQNTKYYLHNYIPLTDGVSPLIKQFQPLRGIEGTEVIITGDNFSEATQVTFGGFPAHHFTVDSDTELRAIVPVEVASGKIGVTNADGTGLSLANFISLTSPTTTLFVPAKRSPGSDITIRVIPY